MKWFNKGLLQLIQLLVLPIFLVILFLYLLLGDLYLWSLLFIIITAYYSIKSIKLLHYHPFWIKAMRKLKLLKKYPYFSIFICSLLLFIGIISFCLKTIFSSSFTIILWSTVATSNWVFYRLIASNVVIYSYFLKSDSFNASYWFLPPTFPIEYRLRKVPQLLRNSISFLAKAFFLEKNLNPHHQNKAIDLLFQRKFYYSINNILDTTFWHFDILFLPKETQIKLFESISKINRIAVLQSTTQYPTPEWNLKFHPNLKIWYLETLRNIDFLLLWFHFAKEEKIHESLLFQFFEYINKELSEFIQHPKSYYLEIPFSITLKDDQNTAIFDTILSQIPFEKDSPIYEQITCTYSLLYVAIGLVNNLE